MGLSKKVIAKFENWEEWSEHIDNFKTESFTINIVVEEAENKNTKTVKRERVFVVVLDQFGFIFGRFDWILEEKGSYFFLRFPSKVLITGFLWNRRGKCFLD